MMGGKECKEALEAQSSEGEVRVRFQIRLNFSGLNFSIKRQ